MRSLAFKETALGPRSRSPASHGETSARACSLRMWVSRRIKNSFVQKERRRYERALRTRGSCGCRMQGYRQGFLPQRKGHGPSRPEAIPQIVVEETAWGVVCPG